MSGGEKDFYVVNPLDPPLCVSKQELFNYFNGDLTDQIHMRNLIETMFRRTALEPYVVVCSTEYGALTADAVTPVVTFRLSHPGRVVRVEASLTTAQASGTTFTVDVKKNGISIFSTLLTIDNTEEVSTTAAVPNVLNAAQVDFSAFDEFTIFITQIGNGTATGLKLMLDTHHTSTGLCSTEVEV